MEIRQFLAFMAEQGASDMFFSANAPVLIKIEGASRPAHKRHLTPSEIKELAYSMMTDTQVSRFERDWEINLGVTFGDLGRFRVNVLLQKGDVAMVVRLVKAEPPTTASLNLPDSLNQLVMERRGLILVAGATGSGKSSTLAAMINYRNEREHGHILTIEEPIEFVHNYKKSIVNQREIGEDTHSYADALKNAMREAPDLILIGEIRDEETMRNAVVYAETGHLCLATIHASNTVETLDRVLNFFPESERRQLHKDLSRNLKAVVCQRLVPGSGGKRIPALEIMTAAPYIKELIARGDIGEIREALERNLEENIVTFDQSLVQLCSEGKISRAAAIANADSRHNVEVKLRLIAGDKPRDGTGGGLSMQEDTEGLDYRR